MNGFDTLLAAAIESIEAQYMQLPIAGQENPVYRERVYCYELYHQLRSRCLVFDAADKAEMAASEADDGPSFAKRLLRETVPDGVRLVMLCRTHRLCAHGFGRLGGYWRHAAAGQ